MPGQPDDASTRPERFSLRADPAFNPDSTGSSTISFGPNRLLLLTMASRALLSPGPAEAGFSDAAPSGTEEAVRARSALERKPAREGWGQASPHIPGTHQSGSPRLLRPIPVIFPFLLRHLLDPICDGMTMPITQQFCLVMVRDANGSIDEDSRVDIGLFFGNGDRRSLASFKHEVQEALFYGQLAKAIRAKTGNGLSPSSWEDVSPGEVIFAQLVVGSTSTPPLSPPPTSAASHHQTALTSMFTVAGEGHPHHLSRSMEYNPVGIDSIPDVVNRSHSQSSSISSLHRHQTFDSGLPPHHTPRSSAPSSRRGSILDGPHVTASKAAPLHQADGRRYRSPSRSPNSSRASSLARGRRADSQTTGRHDIDRDSRRQSSPAGDPFRFYSLADAFELPEGPQGVISAGVTASSQYNSRSASEESLATPADGQEPGQPCIAVELERVLGGLGASGRSSEGRARKAKTFGNIHTAYTQSCPMTARPPSPARPALTPFPDIAALPSQNRPNSPHPCTTSPALRSNHKSPALAPPALRSVATHAGSLSSFVQFSSLGEALDSLGAQTSSPPPPRHFPSAQHPTVQPGHEPPKVYWTRLNV
ncbi:hypothetical protein JCM11641_006532 [Rhodosporidiobolus odoratus]